MVSYIPGLRLSIFPGADQAPLMVRKGFISRGCSTGTLKMYAGYGSIYIVFGISNSVGCYKYEYPCFFAK